MSTDEMGEKSANFSALGNLVTYSQKVREYKPKFSFIFSLKSFHYQVSEAVECRWMKLFSCITIQILCTLPFPSCLLPSTLS